MEPVRVQLMPRLARLTVVTGHYGSGKTNLSLNLALDLARAGETVTLVDLDVVNPYFRSSDHASELTAAGIRVVAPTFAGTTLDAPSLPAALPAALDGPGFVIVDVGGDDAGATALGRYADRIAGAEHDLLYVVNRYRNLTATPEEAAALLAEIEGAAHLRATGVVNNSHLQADTTPETVLDAMPYARETARLLGLPLRFTTVPRALADRLGAHAGDAAAVENAYPVEVRVRTPWHAEPGAREEV